MKTRHDPLHLTASILLVALTLVGCGSDSTPQGDTGVVTADLPISSDLPGNPQVELATTMGKIVLELYPAEAPVTVANFLAYLDAGFYDGTIFHQVFPTVIQGGAFDTNFKQKTTNAPIKNEADNGLSNLRGTIAAARMVDPHSATSRFSINVVDNKPADHVDKTQAGWGYCVFGRVVSGMDVVDQISAVATGGPVGPFDDHVPDTQIVLTSARRL